MTAIVVREKAAFVDFDVAPGFSPASLVAAGEWGCRAPKAHAKSGAFWRVLDRFWRYPMIRLDHRPVILAIADQVVEPAKGTNRMR
jgi:hypothetical protein